MSFQISKAPNHARLVVPVVTQIESSEIKRARFAIRQMGEAAAELARGSTTGARLPARATLTPSRLRRMLTCVDLPQQFFSHRAG